MLKYFKAPQKRIFFTCYQLCNIHTTSFIKQFKSKKSVLETGENIETHFNCYIALGHFPHVEADRRDHVFIKLARLEKHILIKKHLVLIQRFYIEI